MEAAIAVPLPEEGAPVDSAAEGASAGLARAAGINSLGNVASRLLGLVRETVVAGTFGVSGATSSFDAISNVPKMIYELLVGGMLSAALVPVLSEYAVPGRQKELERILSVLLSLVAVVMVAVVALLEVFAPQVAVILLPGFKNDPQLLHTAILLVRLIVPSIFLYGLSGILQAYHYARQRFVYPAMGAPAHNLGVILAVLLLAGRLDVASLSVSIVVAAASQLLAQLPGLRGTHLRFQIDFRHPVVRRILRLYAPVVLSVIVQNIGIVIDRNLASQTVPEAITWMTKATFLIQLPLGLVSMAISLAVLPVLSQIDARNELDSFKRTFSMGIRLVLVVILPSTAAVLAFGGPLIRLVFEHGQFTALDTAQASRALLYYLPGLPFNAIDLPLVFAFYAQKDTLTPVIVGIISVMVYLAVGPLLAFVAGWGYLGLVAANSAQAISHALIMLVLFARRYHGLRGYGVIRTSGAALASSAAVALSGYGSYAFVAHLLPGGLLQEALAVLVGMGLSVGIYVVLARRLGIREIDQVLGAATRRLGRSSA
jgi:putative peptidoglycan lipid II flippase